MLDGGCGVGAGDEEAVVDRRGAAAVPGAQGGAADGAGGVLPEPGVDAGRVEGVAAGGQHAHHVLGLVLLQAHGAPASTQREHQRSCQSVWMGGRFCNSSCRMQSRQDCYVIADHHVSFMIHVCCQPQSSGVGNQYGLITV